MLQIHSSSIPPVCFEGMVPCNKIQHRQIGVVLRHAARFCCNGYYQTSSVTSMLQELGWEDLQSRQDQKKQQWCIGSSLIFLKSCRPVPDSHGCNIKKTSSTLPVIILFNQQLQGILLSINSPPLKWSTCQCNISANFGRLQDHDCEQHVFVFNF